MERIRQLETWARLGYAARGIVYLVLGWIALSSGKALSTSETVQAIEELPGGGPLLAILTFGLFGYGLYKLYTAALDLDNDGTDAKGSVKRIARALGGLAYWFLAFLAAKQLLGGGQGAAEAGQSEGSSGTGQEAATQVADATGGDTLLVVVGLCILGARRDPILHRLQGQVHGRNARRPGVGEARRTGRLCGARDHRRDGRLFRDEGRARRRTRAQLRRCAGGRARRSCKPCSS